MGSPSTSFPPTKWYRGHRSILRQSNDGRGEEEEGRWQESLGVGGWTEWRIDLDMIDGCTITMLWSAILRRSGVSYEDLRYQGALGGILD